MALTPLIFVTVTDGQLTAKNGPAARETLKLDEPVRKGLPTLQDCLDAAKGVGKPRPDHEGQWIVVGKTLIIILDEPAYQALNS